MSGPTEKKQKTALRECRLVNLSTPIQAEIARCAPTSLASTGSLQKSQIACNRRRRVSGAIRCQHHTFCGPPTNSSFAQLHSSDLSREEEWFASPMHGPAPSFAPHLSFIHSATLRCQAALDAVPLPRPRRQLCSISPAKGGLFEPTARPEIGGSMAAFLVNTTTMEIAPIVRMPRSCAGLAVVPLLSPPGTISLPPTSVLSSITAISVLIAITATSALPASDSDSVNIGGESIWQR